MKHSLEITRRIALLGATLPLLGCTEQKFYGLDMKSWGEALKIATGIEDQPGITLEQAAGIPYSSLGYRIGDGAESILVLATSSNGEFLWTSAEHRTLLTRGSRIIQSARLNFNLSASQLLTPDPATREVAGEIKRAQVRRLCDFQDISRYGVEIVGEVESKGSDPIVVLGQQLLTLAFVENCEAKDLKWRFQNTFWSDEKTGFIWKSIQSIHPNLDPITVEILRPPA